MQSTWSFAVVAAVALLLARADLAFARFTVPVDLYHNTGTYVITHGLMEDVNGDHLPDFVETYQGGEGNSVYYFGVWLNNGSDWIAADDWTEENEIQSLMAAQRPFPDILDPVLAAAYLRVDTVEDAWSFMQEHGVPLHLSAMGRLRHQSSTRGWRVAKRAIDSAMNEQPLVEVTLEPPVEDVLERAGCQHLRSIFAEHGIGADILAELNMNDLKQMNIVSVGDRKRLQRAMNNL